MQFRRTFVNCCAVDGCTCFRRFRHLELLSKAGFEEWGAGSDENNLAVEPAKDSAVDAINHACVDAAFGKRNDSVDSRIPCVSDRGTTSCCCTKLAAESRVPR